MDELIKISDVIKICKSLYASYGATAFFVPIPVVDFENLLRTSAVDVDKYVPQWIAVKDKMPQTGESVLVYGKNGISLVGAYWKWGWTTTGYCNVITHWMPLPEPPKENNNGQ